MRLKVWKWKCESVACLHLPPLQLLAPQPPPSVDGNLVDVKVATWLMWRIVSLFFASIYVSIRIRNFWQKFDQMMLIRPKTHFHQMVLQTDLSAGEEAITGITIPHRISPGDEKNLRFFCKFPLIWSFLLYQHHRLNCPFEKFGNISKSDINCWSSINHINVQYQCNTAQCCKAFNSLVGRLRPGKLFVSNYLCLFMCVFVFVCLCLY